MFPEETTSVVSNILRIWQPFVTIRSQYYDGTEFPRPSKSRFDPLIGSAIDLIVTEYDTLADRLGRNFANGDELFEQDLQNIADSDLVQLHNLISGKTVNPSARAEDHNSRNPFIAASASSRPSPGDSADVIPEPEDVEVAVKALVRSASGRTVKALRDLASRLGYLPSTNRHSPVPQLPRSSFDAEDVAYCESALLLQESKADVYGVLERQSSEQHFICKHCHLEISDFRSNAPNYAAEDWSLLASCHVLACSSLKDRRAAYRCFACYARGYNVVEPSAAAIRQHLDACKFRKIWNQQANKSLHKGRTNQSSQVGASQQTFYPPPLSSNAPASESSASPYMQHTSQSSRTTTTVANPHDGARDRVSMSDHIMHSTPRRLVPPAPSLVSADRIAPPVPSLPNPTRVHAAANTGRREENGDDLGAEDFARPPGSFPSTGSLTANTPGTPRHAKIRQPSTPAPVTTPTRPTSNSHRASVSSHPEDTSNRGQSKSSRRHQPQVSNPSATAVEPLPTSMSLVNEASDAAEGAKINELQQLGIPRAQAQSLLLKAGGNLQQAAWLAFSGDPTGGSFGEDQPAPSPIRERRRSLSRRRPERST